MIWSLVALCFGIASLVQSIRLTRRAAPHAEILELRAGTRQRSSRGDPRWSEMGAVGAFARHALESSDAERIDLFAGRLAEVDDETWDVRARVSSWGRVAFFSGAGAAVGHFSSAFRQTTPGATLYAMIPLAIGGLFAIWCHWMGRVAGGAAEERRRAWDRLATMCIGPPVPELDERRSRRQRGPHSQLLDH